MHTTSVWGFVKYSASFIETDTSSYLIIIGLIIYNILGAAFEIDQFTLGFEFGLFEIDQFTLGSQHFLILYWGVGIKRSSRKKHWLKKNVLHYFTYLASVVVKATLLK